jgi:hypothetical protein
MSCSGFQYVFSEIKLQGLVISITELKCSVRTNLERGHAVSFLGIHKWDFRDSTLYHPSSELQRGGNSFPHELSIRTLSIPPLQPIQTVQLPAFLSLGLSPLVYISVRHIKKAQPSHKKQRRQMIDIVWSELEEL